MANSKYESKTIAEVLSEIHESRMYLPAIQRKYVWKNESKITKLFDSIMRGYPIGTFLFWHVKGEVINDKEYSLYEFIREYHEKDRWQNTRVRHKLIDSLEYDVVLDGQQRLTALYMSLYGTLALRKPRGWSSNPDSFPAKELYFNLRSNTTNENDEDEILQYEFKFFKHPPAESPTALWYKVKDILRFREQAELLAKIMANGWTDVSVIKNLSALHSALMNDEIINYYCVKNKEMDEVLDIFVRVNSGGVVLSKTDLLFSTMVSHWDAARDEVDSLLERLNQKGEGFWLGSNFIVQNALYALDFPIGLKVESLKRNNVLKIQQEWKNLKHAMHDAVDLIVDFGFCGRNMTSDLAIAPIIYYIYNGGVLDSVSRHELKKYFIAAQLKRVFSASSNATLKALRAKLQICKGKEFKYADINALKFSNGSTLSFNAEEIDELFELEIGVSTFTILSLLYKELKFANKCFHQDHMHPHSSFEYGNPVNAAIAPETLENWRSTRNQLANLQLLERRENESKNAKPLMEWLKIPDNKRQAKFLPEGISYELSNYQEFIDKRKDLMKEELVKVLQ